MSEMKFPMIQKNCHVLSDADKTLCFVGLNCTSGTSTVYCVLRTQWQGKHTIDKLTNAIRKS